MEVITQNKLQQQLPNATTVLVLGILCLVLGCGIGLVLAIIGLLMSREGKMLNDNYPGQYLGYSNLNAGRIMCIIGICLNGLVILYFIFWIVLFSSIIGAASSWGGLFN